VCLLSSSCPHAILLYFSECDMAAYLSCKDRYHYERRRVQSQMQRVSRSDGVFGSIGIKATANT
jgi:hypothetical protein